MVLWMLGSGRIAAAPFVGWLVLVALGGGPLGGWSWTTTTPVPKRSWAAVRRGAVAPLGASSTSTSNLGSLPPGFPRIVACSTTGELARAVEECVRADHVVAELGSQLREVSTRICERCSRATLVDVARRFPKARDDNNNNTRRTGSMRLAGGAEGFFPDTSDFVEIPRLSDWPTAFFGAENDDDDDDNEKERPGYYDVLVLDVNAIVGNDLEWTSLQLIQQFQSWNAAHRTTTEGDDDDELVVLVKSVGLNKWASSLIHANHWRDHHETLSQLPPPHVVATRGVHEYRSTIPHTVRPTDFVLEVGCHFGTSTAILGEAAAHCIGVDVGSKIIREAKKKHPGTDFRVGDAWKTAELLRFQQDYYRQSAGADGRIGYDVVYVDVGGLSGSDGIWEALQLVSSLRFALEPRTIVIKSLCMQRLSSRLVPYWQLQKRARAREASAASAKAEN